MTEPGITIHTPALTQKEAAELLAKRSKGDAHMAVVPVKAAPAKPGYMTSEFWITILATLGAIAASATDNLPPRYAAIASMVSVVAYAISRGLAKQ